MIAKFGAICGRCDQPIVAGRSDIVIRHGSPIHMACAPGSDDE